jgi:acyl carrier protein
LVARHLVAQHGVRRLLLLSRKGAPKLARELTEMGAEATSIACDVSDRAALQQSLSGVALKAVFHCAGVVDDGALTALDPSRIDRVFGPKVDAALHLHQSPSLELLVFFSSVSGVMGAAGQASYAAANTFLDALAAHRTQRGLPTLSLAWGLWEPSTIGMTAGLTKNDLDRIRRQGITPLSHAEGLELLDLALARSDSMLVPARLELEEVRHQARPIAVRRRLSGLAPAERHTALLKLVRAEIGAVCRLPSQDVADDEPLESLGLDSLMALELRDRLASSLEASLPATLAFDHPTPTAIVRFVETVVLHGDVPQPKSAIDDLSNEELASLVRSL